MDAEGTCFLIHIDISYPWHQVSNKYCEAEPHTAGSRKDTPGREGKEGYSRERRGSVRRPSWRSIVDRHFAELKALLGTQVSFSWNTESRVLGPRKQDSTLLLAEYFQLKDVGMASETRSLYDFPNLLLLIPSIYPGGPQKSTRWVRVTSTSSNQVNLEILL